MAKTSRAERNRLRESALALVSQGKGFSDVVTAQKSHGVSSSVHRHMAASLQRMSPKAEESGRSLLLSVPRRCFTSFCLVRRDNADAVTESTGTIGTISMSPKTVGAYSKFSRLMELQSTPDIEQLIRTDFVALLADAIDTAAINGSGSSSQPTGILQRQVSAQ